MILLFTDFGAEGPYLGQIEAVLHARAPGVKVINLVSDAPAGDPRLGGYLLASLAPRFPEHSVFLGVVDPEVGGGRLPIILEADGRWFVGPENGLFNTVAVHARRKRWWIIEWRPERLSMSFHGRDLFAPVAAEIACGAPPLAARPYPGPELSGWPPDTAAVVYVDHYGNALTGWRHSCALDGKTLVLPGGQRIARARTFCAVEAGRGFWYENSCGLVEIAVNRGRADRAFGLSPGVSFRFEP